MSSTFDKNRAKKTYPFLRREVKPSTPEVTTKTVTETVTNVIREQLVSSSFVVKNFVTYQARQVPSEGDIRREIHKHLGTFTQAFTTQDELIFVPTSESGPV